MKNNRFKRLTVIVLMLLFVVSLVGCKTNGKTKVKLAEVAHSVFYAPQYAALSLGYFEEEGLQIELVNANGADKVTAALLSGDIHIGLQGPEPTIYLYNNDKSNYLVNFAQLTQTDGSFIFGREANANFTLEDLIGKSILGGRKGGVPEMTLEYVLKEAGLTVVQDADRPLDVSKKEVNVRTDIAFGAMAGSFISGEGDFTTLFEPTATEIIKEGKAHLLSSVGQYAGKVAYTAYSTTLKYFNNNKETLEKFTKAVYRGQKFVMENDDLTVAKAIAKHFPDTTEDVLEQVVARYRAVNAWTENPVFIEDSFERLMDIMNEAGELAKRVPFTTIVDTSIARKVIYG